MSNAISVLNDLITISKDGEQGFRKIAEEITIDRLKATFADRARGCAQAVSELQNHVEKLGGSPTDSGSILGALHRGWIDIKSAVIDRDTHAILEECERGEDAARVAYSKALETDLPEDVRILIEKQYEVVKQNHNMVRSLRDEYAGENE